MTPCAKFDAYPSMEVSRQMDKIYAKFLFIYTLKGDIIQQHIETQSMRCRQYHLFMIFAVFDALVLVVAVWLSR